MREVPFGNDGDFSRSAMIGRMNGDLANDLGNLAQRILSMIAKNCGAAVPTPGAFTERDQEILGQASALLDGVTHQLDRQAFNRALEAIWAVISEGNRYVDEQAPWTLKKTDPPRMETVLYVLAEVVRRVSILVQPFMPESAGKLLDQLAVSEDNRSFASFDVALSPKTALPKPQGVFPRYVEPEQADEQKE